MEATKRQQLRIEGGSPLRGRIPVRGSKNAATKILIASILTSESVTLTNVPTIEDVDRVLDILKSLGVAIKRDGHTLSLEGRTVEPDNLDASAVRQLRASAVLMGALLGRFHRVRIPGPGGDQIGSRPLDTHLQALRILGAEVEEVGDEYQITLTAKHDVDLTMPEFSVTATENVILASVLRAGVKTKISCAAADPSVQDLCWFLQSLGAQIEGIGTHTLDIVGTKTLHGTDGYGISPDPVEAGTFMCLAGAARGEIVIEEAPIDFLRSELQKFSEVNLDFETQNRRLHASGHYFIADVVVRPSTELRAIRNVHNMPYPGFNPDLLPPFTVLLTQASGTSLVHDWMYEGRLRYVDELNKMGAEIFVSDPHRILVTGPRALYGTTITNYDIRTGASLVIAAVVASGTSLLAPVYQLDRGYERLEERLKAIGASIKREDV